MGDSLSNETNTLANFEIENNPKYPLYKLGYDYLEKNLDDLSMWKKLANIKIDKPKD